MRAILMLLLLAARVFPQQAPANPSASALSQNTLFVDCAEGEKPKQVLSPVWLSEDEKWRTYVEVNVQGGTAYKPVVGRLSRLVLPAGLFRALDAGFSSDGSSSMVIRARFFSLNSLFGPEEKDLPPAQRCVRTEEKWKFDYVTGDVRQVANTEPLQLFKKFLFPRDN